SYVLAFSLISFLGIIFGMLLRIKAYLFLGVVFFTLNIIANVLQKGLRDQKTGFIILTISGLMIIGSLIYYTLNKEKILKSIQRFRKKLDNYD
ncbi:MAG: hypothetical protein KDK36_01920, partial [Leptospiraceae bacterium]|nr:hypothetical protein [Leptospiraceae bacterium]